MDDTISRAMAIDAVAKALKGTFVEYEDIAEKIINNLPSAEPETAKRIVGKSRDGLILWYQCDMCNEPVGAQANFCCGCGRRLTDG